MDFSNLESLIKGGSSMLSQVRPVGMPALRRGHGELGEDSGVRHGIIGTVGFALQGGIREAGIFRQDGVHLRGTVNAVDGNLFDISGSAGSGDEDNRPAGH